MTTDETRRILDLLSQGKITVDEADRLLKAIGTVPPATNAATEAGGDEAKRRWVRINIHKPAKDSDGKAKDVNIRVPMAVVRGGMRLGAIIGTFAGEKAALRMKRRGVDLDLDKINSDFSKMNGPEFDAFMKSLDDTNIEIDDGASTVRITTE